MAEMAGSMGTSMCHDGSEMSDDCCEAQSAPEPMQALSLESAKLLAALEVTAFQIGESPSPADLSLYSTPVDAFRLHDLGRYTLYSSFLL